MFKKDNLVFGLVIGLIAPMLGLLLFKIYKFQTISFADTLRYMVQEQGYRTLSVALSVSLLANALLFTAYINSRKDQTAKGIFATTVIYGVIILAIKTFG